MQTLKVFYAYVRGLIRGRDVIGFNFLRASAFVCYCIHVGFDPKKSSVPILLCFGFLVFAAVVVVVAVSPFLSKCSHGHFAA